MSKVAVIYWSSTGNTEAMAEAVRDGAAEAGAEVDYLTCDQVGSISGYSGIALGCSAMGDEELDQDEFQPMWDSIKGSLAGKKVALFGSYGWGDGEWMRSWEDDAKENGIALAAESVICNETPDDDGLKQCKDLGKAIA